MIAKKAIIKPLEGDKAAEDEASIAAYLEMPPDERIKAMVRLSDELYHLNPRNPSSRRVLSVARFV